MNRILSIVLSAALVFGGLSLTAGSAAAAECKGLSKNRCESSDSCTWVGGYSRSDGAKVTASPLHAPADLDVIASEFIAKLDTSNIAGAYRALQGSTTTIHENAGINATDEFQNGDVDSVGEHRRLIHGGT